MKSKFFSLNFKKKPIFEGFFLKIKSQKKFKMQQNNVFMLPELEILKLFEKNTAKSKCLLGSDLPRVFSSAIFPQTSVKTEEFFKEFFLFDAKLKEELFIYEEFRIIALLLHNYPDYTSSKFLLMKSYLKYPIESSEIIEEKGVFPLKFMMKEIFFMKKDFHAEMKKTVNLLILEEKKPILKKIEEFLNDFKQLMSNKNEMIEVFKKFLEKTVKNQEKIQIKPHSEAPEEQKSNALENPSDKPSDKSLPSGSITLKSLFLLIETHTCLNKYPSIYMQWLKRISKKRNSFFYNDYEEALIFAEKLIEIYLDYRMLDHNNDGQISVQEYVNSIEKLHIKTKEKNFLKDYHMINQNEEDGIDYSELCEFILPETDEKNLYEYRLKEFFFKYNEFSEEIKQGFRLLDQNSDGKVSRNEFLAGFAKLKGKKIKGIDVFWLFDTFDRDKDGWITLQEFMEGGEKMGVFIGEKEEYYIKEENVDKNDKKEENVEKNEENVDKNHKKEENVEKNQENAEENEEKNEENVENEEKNHKNDKNEQKIKRIQEKQKQNPSENNSFSQVQSPNIENFPKIPKKSPFEFNQEFLANQAILSQDSKDFPFIDELEPKDRILTFNERKIGDFFTTLKEMMQKDTEEAPIGNLQYVMRAIKAFFLIVKEENKPEAPKFLHLNTMLSDFIEDLDKENLGKQVFLLKDYYEKHINSKDFFLEKVHKESEQKTKEILDLRVITERNEEELKKMAIFNEKQEREITEEKAENLKKTHEIFLLKERDFALKSQNELLSEQIEINMRNLKKMEENMNKLVFDIKKQEKILNNKEKLVDEEKNQIFLQKNMLKTQENDMKEKYDKIERNLKAYEQSLNKKAFSLEKLNKSTWEQINNEAKDQQEKFVLLLKEYKEDLEIKNLMKTYKNQENYDENSIWKNEKEGLLALIKEFVMKIAELEEKNKKNSKNNENIKENDGEIEKLRGIVKKLGEENAMMKLMSGTPGMGDYKVLWALVISFIIGGGFLLANYLNL